jgi:transcriptional regulator with XRE-family HTH domain
VAPSRPRAGITTGYLLKLVRESIPLSQERLAEATGVDRGTIQGWESGRRPFTAVPFGQAVALRHQLTRLGGDAVLVNALNDAAEADFLLGEIVNTQARRFELDVHPLAYSVLTHKLVEMLSWSITGQLPAVVAARLPVSTARRGPVAAGPQLGRDERDAFFSGLRVAASRATGDGDRAVLLHRQACFLSGLDPASKASAWLSTATSSSYFVRAQPWSQSWADARSVATALARQGDPEPLRAFIANGQAHDSCEHASLNYWAYWVGELPDRQHDDQFMAGELLIWRGSQLLRHLADRLSSEHRFIDLNVHTVWALLAARRGVAGDDPQLAGTLYRRCEQLLDEGAVSVQSKRELTSVLYGLRMDGTGG